MVPTEDIVDGLDDEPEPELPDGVSGDLGLLPPGEKRSSSAYCGVRGGFRCDSALYAKEGTCSCGCDASRIEGTTLGRGGLWGATVRPGGGRYVGSLANC